MAEVSQPDCRNNMTTASSTLHSKKAKTEHNKVQKRLRRETGRAIQDYNMIEAGDRVMVCLSGGKDSYTMLKILRNLQKSAPIDFELVAVNLDQKQPGFPEHVLPEYLKAEGVPFHILERDTYSIVQEQVPEGKTTCGICSRLRRGTLYAFADKIGATKIALGHHRDDILETFFLNLFFGGKLKAMPPKLKSDSESNILIRPLAYCKEADIIRYAEFEQFPIIPCNLCGSQENLQRQNIKQMLHDWDRQYPGRSEIMFNALQNIAPSQLADRNLFNFEHLKASAIPLAHQADTGPMSPLAQTRVNSFDPTQDVQNGTEKSINRAKQSEIDYDGTDILAL